MLVVLVTFSRPRRYIVSQTTVPRQLKTICTEFTTGYELLMRHLVVCVEYAIRLGALWSCPLTSDRSVWAKSNIARGCTSFPIFNECQCALPTCTVHGTLWGYQTFDLQAVLMVPRLSGREDFTQSVTLHFYCN